MPTSAVRFAIFLFLDPQHTKEERGLIYINKYWLTS
jgi:hypothetical protein